MVFLLLSTVKNISSLLGDKVKSLTENEENSFGRLINVALSFEKTSGNLNVVGFATSTNKLFKTKNIIAIFFTH